MKVRILAIVSMMLVTVSAFADDGELFRRNVSKTPDLETEHAYIKMLELYVPAQKSDGTLLEKIEYKDAEGAIADERTMAKPLIAFYQDGLTVPVPDVGFPGHNHHDIYGAVSLDDGATWKRTNLSKSGDLSSFTLKDGTKYPGGVVRLFAASAGKKVLAVWASRYARGGSPNYAMDDTQRGALATYLGIDVEDLYLNDLFGVSGSQGSSDFADEGYPTVGEVPYCALWTARGTLEEVLDENGTATHKIVWRKAERLTSGVRDAHRMEAAAVEGAGFIVTWQEDPEGLRPGKGEGPGEGWSGAIAHHQTDIWYSYISWDNFDFVSEDGSYSSPISLAEYEKTTIPSVGIPMSIPVRITDNAMCQNGVDNEDDLYCSADFNGNGAADFCASTVTVTIETPEGPVQDIELCVTENGRLLRGNIAATRARVNLQGYDSDDDGVNDSAWVVVAYEESKGLGEEEDLDPNDLIEKVDMGKNIWYHTFDMFTPELVSQGMILNQPAVYPDDWTVVGGRLKENNDWGYRFMQIDPDPIYEEQASLESTLYQAEIARRFSLISQSAAEAGPSGTVAFAMWKQGIIRQGGPADVMARRFVLPDDFNPAEDNPFDYANMECGTWAFPLDADGKPTNPRYVKGLCVESAINLSGTSIVTCDTGSEDCAADFPWNEYFDDIAGGTVLAKMTEWSQSGPDFNADISIDNIGNLDDTTWENPYEVAKGHRGFMSGDFIMVLYAWSPNWLANTVGHDTYNLYVRRSFDGGQTWTTTPNASPWTDVDGVVADGTNTCETYRDEALGEDGTVCTDYAAGAFEPARNVSQLIGTQVTILDPRYSPTTDSILQEDGSFLYPDDERNPSKFFIVYETGDNSTVAEGEATPLNLYYSRAINWGDEYDLADIDDDDIGDTFDWLENKKKYHSGEGSITANPGGTFFYAVWNQWQEDKHENVFDSDAIFRRVLYLDEDCEGEDCITPPPVDDDDGEDSGGGGGAKPKKR
ncbi:hypothetical protein DENIS_1675 [Desulfonema ishimotonii]|uniref:Exo-alpha-sialidase n=1 Tax=Desulfonema ishimotonii TaxID=45657 RepID=A0A401FUT9_9BACT|nr:choice-of-anchor O protein [Desulfonema ishimotonii]GBC60718.1 hypothetical protein DENIS_1675 [Desulfonema ishimotonii]